MIKTSPRGGQLKALELCKKFEGFLLFPEQRVGKTWVALAAADYRRPRKLLIVTRKGGRAEWAKQIDFHLKIDWDCEIRIETHEFFSRGAGPKQIRKWFKKSHRDDCMIILDESHKIKKRGTSVSRSLRQIAKRYARYRLALSGTPIGEGLENGWAQMDFVDPSVFGSYDDFVARFCKLGGFRGVKIIGYRNRELFRKMLARRSYRVLLREVQPVPTKIVNHFRYFDLPEDVWKIYRDLEEGIDVEVGRKKIRLKELMHAATKCHQLTGGFIIRSRDDDDIKLDEPEVLPVHGHKLFLLRSILKQHLGEKMVVTAKYKHELVAIGRVCRGLGLIHKTIRGGQPYDGKFNVDVIIIQIQAGIVIDLAESSIAIFYSADYSFIINAQMRSRILSYDKEFARYYYLLGRNTIDEAIYQAWRTKRKLSDVILDKRRRRG